MLAKGGYILKLYKQGNTLCIYVPQEELGLSPIFSCLAPVGLMLHIPHLAWTVSNHIHHALTTNILVPQSLNIL